MENETIKKSVRSESSLKLSEVENLKCWELLSKICRYRFGSRGSDTFSWVNVSGEVSVSRSTWQRAIGKQHSVSVHSWRCILDGLIYHIPMGEDVLLFWKERCEIEHLFLMCRAFEGQCGETAAE